jgi:thymidylate synthase (FAD)
MELVLDKTTADVATVKTALPTVELMSITPNGEDIIERACRTCYLSFNRYDPPKSTEELIKKILRHGHFSVLEHAIATFRVKGGSRVFTHEMVRHRLVSPSQESQRYVCYADRPGDPDAKSFKDRPRKKTRDFEVVVPPTVEQAGFDDGTDPREVFLDACEEIFELYERLLSAGVPPEDARYILPNATTSEIVLTGNFREWRHVCTVRCTPQAHWEIRSVMMQILQIMKREAPVVFHDFRLDLAHQTAERLDPEIKD